MKELLAFKDQALEKVKAEQKRAAGETEKVKQRVPARAARPDEGRGGRRCSGSQKLAGEARRRRGAGAARASRYRTEDDYEQSREALADLERALGMKDLGAALETAQRARPPVERLARYLEEDAALSQQLPADGAARPAGARATRARRRGEGGAAAREMKRRAREALPRPAQRLPPEAQAAARASWRSSRASSSSRRERAPASRSPSSCEQAPDLPAGGAGVSSASRAATWAERGGRARAAQPAARPRRAASSRWTRSRASRRGSRRRRSSQGRRRGRRDGLPVPVRQSGGRRGAGDGREPSREKVRSRARRPTRCRRSSAGTCSTR